MTEVNKREFQITVPSECRCATIASNERMSCLHRPVCVRHWQYGKFRRVRRRWNSLGSEKAAGGEIRKFLGGSMVDAIRVGDLEIVFGIIARAGNDDLRFRQVFHAVEPASGLSSSLALSKTIRRGAQALG